MSNLLIYRSPLLKHNNHLKRRTIVRRKYEVIVPANPAKPFCKHLDHNKQVGPEVTIRTGSGNRQQCCLSCAVDTVLAIQRYSEPFKVISLINFFPRGKDNRRNYERNRDAFRAALLTRRRELYAEGLRREAYQTECTVDFLDTMRGYTMPVTHEQRAAKRKAKAEKLAKLERMEAQEA